MDERERYDAPKTTDRGRYRTPRLTRYGDMRRITAGTKGGTKGDGPDNPSGPASRVVS